MKYPLYISFILCFSLGVLSCSGDSQQRSIESENDSTPEYADNQEEGEYVILTKVQTEKIGIQLGKITPKSMKGSVALRGKLDVPSKNKAKVSPLITALITDVYPEPGVFVKKGQKLAAMTDLQLIDLQQEYLHQQAELEMLTQEVARQKALHEENINAKKVLEQSQTRLAQVSASKESLKLKLGLLGIDAEKLNGENLRSTIFLRAPISGFLTDIQVNVGQKVISGDVLFQIVNTHHMHADLLLYEKDLALVEIDQRVELFRQDNPSVTYEAEVFAIGKEVDEAQRAVLVHAEVVEETDDLLPGMYVEGRITTSQESRPSLPRKAVVSAQNLDFIFWQEKEEGEMLTFKRVPVIKSIEDAGFVEVTPLEELPEDADIVIDGSFYLLAESLKNSGGGGDDH